MESIQIVPNVNTVVFTLPNRIRCEFGLVNKLPYSFHDCCFKVSLGEQISRFDIPQLDGRVDGLAVDFDSVAAGCGRTTMLCQLFQDDRLVAVLDHGVNIIDPAH